MRWTLALILALLFWSFPAFGAEPSLRTALVPTTGAAFGAHRSVTIAAQAQARLGLAGGEGPSAPDPVGVLLRAGPSFNFARILAFDLSYAYAWGFFPADGPGVEEHQAQVGFRISTPRDGGRRLALANRTRLDLRTYRTDADPWGFHLRPRNQTMLTVIAEPWMQFSLLGEFLAQRDLGPERWMQLRTGLAVHGRIDLGQDRSQTPQATLSWIVGNQLAFHPLEYLFGGNDAGSGEESNYLDMVVTVGLSGSF